MGHDDPCQRLVAGVRRRQAHSQLAELLRDQLGHRVGEFLKDTSSRRPRRCGPTRSPASCSQVPTGVRGHPATHCPWARWPLGLRPVTQPLCSWAQHWSPWSLGGGVTPPGRASPQGLPGLDLERSRAWHPRQPCPRIPGSAQPAPATLLHTCTCAHMCRQTRSTHPCTRVHKDTGTRAHIETHSNRHVHECVHAHAHTEMHAATVCTPGRTYTRMHIHAFRQHNHTCMRTHTDTCTCAHT